MAIKEILREELANSQRMQAEYEARLASLPEGSLIRKKIGRYRYYYIVCRREGRVHFQYKGREVPRRMVDEYARAKELRAKYRKLLAVVKKQVRYLKGVLRGRAAI